MSKGRRTKQGIVEVALRQAGKVGLEGLSIGGLAKDVGMSKSGLFGHFGSKQELQIEILRLGATCFIEEIVTPAMHMPRGIARLRALYQNWLEWAEGREREGGCVFVSGAFEFDDRPGPVRDVLSTLIGEWITTLRRAAAISIEEGHLRSDIDPDQIAYSVHAFMLEYNVRSRLFEDNRAHSSAMVAFETLMQSSRA